MFLSLVIAVVGLAEEIDHVSLLQMKVRDHNADDRSLEEVEVGGSPTCLSASDDCTCSVPPAQICSGSRDVTLNKDTKPNRRRVNVDQTNGDGETTKSCFKFMKGWEKEMETTKGSDEDLDLIACMDKAPKDPAQHRVEGEFAYMNVACGEETNLAFSFEYYDSSRTIVEDVALTFYDLNDGIDGEGRISLETCGQSQTLVAEDTNLNYSVNGNCATVTSNVAASSVTYSFSNFEHMRTKVSVAQCTVGSRNIVWNLKPAVACAGGDAAGKCPTTTTTTMASATTIAPVVGAEDDPHLTDTSGNKFDLYQDGRQTFLVIPKGVSKAKADLHIRGTVERRGERENDLWIRNLEVSGKWVPGGSFQFKTADGIFNSDSTLLVRHLKTDTWKSLNDFKDANLLSISDLDEAAPTEDFGESLARKVILQTGPVKVLVNYGTAQKSGEDVNHLDLHVEGLGSVASSGGLLSGEVVAY